MGKWRIYRCIWFALKKNKRNVVKSNVCGCVHCFSIQCSVLNVWFWTNPTAIQKYSDVFMLLITNVSRDFKVIQTNVVFVLVVHCKVKKALFESVWVNTDDSIHGLQLIAVCVWTDWVIADKIILSRWFCRFRSDQRDVQQVQKLHHQWGHWPGPGIHHRPWIRTQVRVSIPLMIAWWPPKKVLKMMSGGGVKASTMKYNIPRLCLARGLCCMSFPVSLFIFCHLCTVCYPLNA